MTEFRNRLVKMARHLRRWPSRGITCYRLYERDIPAVPLVVDRYEKCLHIAEFARPHNRTEFEHARWLKVMCDTAAEALDTDPALVFCKLRDRQRGASQYRRLDLARREFVVSEGGLKFLVNLSDFVDTGLFLDHRCTRNMVRKLAPGTRFLNLFGYTGSFSVYAAAGGAVETTTVDLSKTYVQWGKKNFLLNDLHGPTHRWVQEDAMRFVNSLDDRSQYDLVVVDPPTFSNSKRTEGDWQVQRDHGALLSKVVRHLSPGGIILFSSNFRKFQLEIDGLKGIQVREISRQTVPEDFRNRRIHRCWRIEKGGTG
ncbi:MAG: class I SAM-dependent methyltransferase [Pirellulaceae bacterium]